MGFLNSLFESMVETGTNRLAEQYRNIPLEELKSKWNAEFKNRSYKRENIYQTPSPLSVLDETYSWRTGKRSWLSMCEQSLKAEEQAQKAKEEKENANDKFEKALSTNDMVKEIIEKIDELSYDAFTICIEEDRIVCCNSEEEELLTIRYKKYGYPNLDEDKRAILCEYIEENIKLEYEYSNDYELELDDAPGGMKSSW